MAIDRMAMKEKSHDKIPNRKPAAPVGMVIQIKPVCVARSIGVVLESVIHCLGVLLESAIQCLKAIRTEIQSPTILDPPLVEKVEQPQEDPKHKISTQPPPSTKQQEQLQQEETATLEQQTGPLQVDWKAVEHSIHKAADSVAQVDWKTVEHSIQEAMDSVDWKEVAERVDKVDWEQVRRTWNKTGHRAPRTGRA